MEDFCAPIIDCFLLVYNIAASVALFAKAEIRGVRAGG